MSDEDSPPPSPSLNWSLVPRGQEVLPSESTSKETPGDPSQDVEASTFSRGNVFFYVQNNIKKSFGNRTTFVK